MKHNTPKALALPLDPAMAAFLSFQHSIEAISAFAHKKCAGINPYVFWSLAFGTLAVVMKLASTAAVPGCAA